MKKEKNSGGLLQTGRRSRHMSRESLRNYYWDAAYTDKAALP